MSNVRKCPNRGAALLSLCALVGATLYGCKATTPPAPVPPTPQAGQSSSAGDRNDHVVRLSQDTTPQPGAPRDPAPAVRLLYIVDVFQLEVPHGTFSHNDEFWKRIDESIVDVGTHDLLYKNGVRVGSAPLREFENFKKYVDVNMPTKRLSVAGHEAQNIELTMNAELPGQEIFVFDNVFEDGLNPPLGRAYDKCSNFLNLSFAPTPRDPHSVRVALCPMVRTMRKRLEFSAVGSLDQTEREIQYVSPEMFYNLNLRVDLPIDRFLVVAPSEEAIRTTSVGGAFLMKNGPTDREEQVILIMPHLQGEIHMQDQPAH